jgi:dipeptidyl aminopeptidase/acylaminoacyl peptidase
VGTRLGSAREGLGVDRVDTRTARATRVEAPRIAAYDYVTDGRGNLRIMGLMSSMPDGYDRGLIHFSFRRKGETKWESLGTFDRRSETGFLPTAVDPDLDVAYGWRKHEGRWALFTKALDGTGTESLSFSHPEVDVASVIRIGRRGRVVGATYVTDLRYPEYFDPATGRLVAALAKALPQHRLLRVVDASVDESRLLVWAGSDDDPGVYYLFDRPNRELKTTLVVRPELEGVQLARMRAITYPAEDGTQVPGYLTLPPGADSPTGLPALVLPHGGPNARDEWGFDWLSQFFALRGYAVLQPNFRGSAGYGDAWLRQNGFKSWRVAVGDVVDAGRWLIREGADPKRLAILGWSYGGYAALMSAAVMPDLFKAVVAIAPVTDLDALKEESRAFSNFGLVSDFIGSGPHLREGSPAEQAARIKSPVLLFHGALDSNVGIGQSRRLVERLSSEGRSVRFVPFDELDHYLTDSAARTRVLAESDRFMAEAFAAH